MAVPSGPLWTTVVFGFGLWYPRVDFYVGIPYVCVPKKFSTRPGLHSHQKATAKAHAAQGALPTKQLITLHSS
eukprot:scaffold26065_cov109-Skeletonema_marinoi.AAC.2